MATKTKEFSPSDLPRLLLRFLTSYGLAAVVLVLMTVITLLGTLNQVEEGLFDSQKKYFESFFFTDKLHGVPIFLPGGYLLMAILFFNLLAGTILKIRKNMKSIGLYLAHFGILFLIVSSFVTKHYSWEGNMTLYEGMTSHEVTSYHDWQLEIIPIEEEGKASEALVIPYQDFNHASPKNPVTLEHESIPFDVVIEDYHRNSLPIPTSAPIAAQAEGKEVNGYKLMGQKPEKEAEGNFPGVRARFVPEGEGDAKEAIIWAHVAIPTGEKFTGPIPHTIEFDGKKYNVQLVRKRYRIPFDLQLDDFILETYAGVSTAKNYQSDVTKIQNGDEEKHSIKMNEPLRYSGYTFFQSKYGPQNAQPGENYYSVFAVVKNPADHWPLYSLIIVAAGLFIHLVMKLYFHLNRSEKAERKLPGNPPTPDPV